MNIFYRPDISADRLLLDERESHHCLKVMRFRKGEEVRIIDGKGGFFIAKIEIENPKACGVKIISKHENYMQLPYELHIAIAPTKSLDRFEWFIEKATEIGITSITPLICKRSERRSLRMDRLVNVAVSAMKQSVKAYLPRLNDPVEYSAWVGHAHPGLKFIAHCMDGPKKDILNVRLSDITNVIIGPEGDFTPDELQRAIDNNFIPLSLGDYRLRTETAGLMVCSAVYLKAAKASDHY
jgi:16S rRNA (uracil1498-N3)-methyltransferase